MNLTDKVISHLSHGGESSPKEIAIAIGATGNRSLYSVLHSLKTSGRIVKRGERYHATTTTTTETDTVDILIHSAVFATITKNGKAVLDLFSHEGSGMTVRNLTDIAMALKGS